MFPHKDGGWVDIWLDEKGFILDSKDKHIAELIKSGKVNKLVIPIIDKPDENDYDVSRFLAKVGLEFLALKSVHNKEWIAEITNKIELDPIRNFARYGNKNFWKYHQRRIYSEEDRFVDPVNHPVPYEILHELDFLYSEEGVMYFIMVIMGIEYAINLAESETEFYEKWLKDNNNISPIRRFTEYMITNKNKNEL